MIRIFKYLIILIFYMLSTTLIAKNVPSPEVLTTLSPEEFQQSVKQTTLENLKQSSEDYKRLYNQINPLPSPPPQQSANTTMPPANGSGPLVTSPSPSTPEENEEVDSNAPNNTSTYYFQNKTPPSDSSATPSGGFNPYGTSKKE